MATTAFVNVVANTSNVPGQLTADLTTAIHLVEIRIPPIEIRVQVDTNSLAAAARQADRTGFSFGSLIGIAGRVLKGLTVLTSGLALTTTAVGGLGVAVSSMVSSLGGVSGIVNQAAGAVGVAGAAFAVFKVATIGVSDAIAALGGTAEEFEEAIAGLAPAAQTVAREFRATVPAFQGFQQSLQQSLFAQIAGEGVAKSFAAALKTIQPNAQLVARSFGNVGLALAEFITKESTLRNINTILKATAPIVERLGELFISFAGGALERAALGVGEFSGTMDALWSAIRAVARVASDIGRIFGAITDAAERAGVSLGGPLATGLDLVADLFESPAGREFLDTMIELGSTILSTIAPVIGTLLKTLAPLVSILAQALTPAIKLLGPPLQTLIKALGGALEPIIKALAPVLLSFVGAFGALVKAVTPLLPVIGQLAAALLPALIPLFDSLSQIFTLLAPLIVQLGTSLSTILQPILAILPELVQSLLEPSLELAQVAFPLLVDVLIALTPAFAAMAQIIATLLPALIPIITATTTLATQLLSFLGPAIRFVAGLVGKIATAFLGFVNGVLNAVVVPALEGLAAIFRGDFRAAFNSALTIVRNVGNLVIGFFRALPGRATSALSTLIPFLSRIAISAMRLFLSGITSGARNAVSFVSRLPRTLLAAIGNVGRLLYNSGQALIRGFIDGIKSMGTAARNAASSIASSVRNLFPFSPAKEGPFSGRGFTTYSGVSLIEGFLQGIESAAPGLKRGLSQALAGVSEGTVLAPSLAGAAGAAAIMGQNFGLQPITTAAPNVFVSIGNEAVDKHVDVRVERISRARDRELAQGIRR